MDPQFGRSGTYDAGTDGDVFVDGVSGSDSNNGLTSGAAKATFAAGLTAVKAMTGDRTLRLMGDGVRYYEQANTNIGSLDSLAIKSYGTDVPFLSGAKVLGSFTQCTSGDETVVGANFASIYKTTIATTEIAHSDYWRMLLSENGMPLKLSVLRADQTVDPLFTDATTPMYEENVEATLTMGLSGANYDTITHTAALGSYSDAQLEQTVAGLHAFPNINAFVKVASVSSGVLQLTASSYRPASGAGNGAYSLFNVLPAIEEGGWGWRDNGDSTITFYVWPNDTASLVSGIEIAASKYVLKLIGSTGVAANVTIEGVGLEMCSWTITDFSDAALFLNSGDNYTIKQVIVDRVSNSSAHMLYCKFNSDVAIESCMFRRGQGTFGIGCTDSGGTGITGHRWANILAKDLSQTGWRAFGLRDSVLADLEAIRTSAGGHANTINLYSGCDRVAVLGFKGSIVAGERPVTGYATNQASSRFMFLNCTFTMGTDFGWGYVDQNGATAVPNTGDAYLVNCWIPHEPAIVDAASNPGINVGNSVFDWHVYNCVTPKINVSTGTVTRKNNVLTKSDATTADASETVVSDIDTLHVDAANGDFDAVPGGLLTTETGYDVSAVIEQFEEWLPSENFRRDILGRAWSPANPGIGPYGRNWPT